MASPHQIDTGCSGIRAVSTAHHHITPYAGLVRVHFISAARATGCTSIRSISTAHWMVPYARAQGARSTAPLATTEHAHAQGVSPCVGSA
eukprot:413968-Rhodomonas_salina.6